MCHQDLQMFSHKLKKIRNVHPLEVVGRETQLQVGENYMYLIKRS